MPERDLGVGCAGGRIALGDGLTLGVLRIGDVPGVDRRLVVALDQQ